MVKITTEVKVIPQRGHEQPVKMQNGIMKTTELKHRLHSLSDKASPAQPQAWAIGAANILAEAKISGSIVQTHSDSLDAFESATERTCLFTDLI